MKILKNFTFRSVLMITLLTTSLMAPTTQVHANDDYPICNAASCRGFVSRVIFDNAGQLFIAIEGANIGALTNCTAVNGLARVPSTDPNQKSLYALALTAFSLQEPVQVAILQGNANCDVAFMNLFN